MLSHLSPSRLALALVLATTVTVSAQKPDAGAVKLDTGPVSFEKIAISTNSLRKQLLKGDLAADPRNKSHVEAIEIAAKEVIYPLYWLTSSGRPKFGEINGLVERFDSELTKLSHQRTRAATVATQLIFCRHAIDAAAEVMQDKATKPIAMVNAARVLSCITQRRAPRDIVQNEKEWAEEVVPRLAEGNGERLAAVCVQLLEDPKVNDGARYYLFRALANLVGLPAQSSPVVKKETAEKVFAVALKQVEKKSPFPKATPRQEVEGYKILRLQAVKVLSQAGAPAVGKERVGLTLARVAGNDEAIVPSPRIEERVEAAIGLCRMGAAAAKTPEFHIDYAAAQVARATAALGRLANANLDSKPAQRLAPWSVEAARLLEAVEGLKHDVKVPYVQQVADQCVQQVLAPLERRTATKYAELTDWLGLNPPASQTLFKGDDKSAIKPGAEEAVKEKEEKE